MRLRQRAAGAADLLVVGDDRGRLLVVHDEAQVGLVEAHAERDRGHQGLDVVAQQPGLERLALLVVEPAVVRRRVDAPKAQPAGDAARRRRS